MNPARALYKNVRDAQVWGGLLAEIAAQDNVTLADGFEAEASFLS